MDEVKVELEDLKEESGSGTPAQTPARHDIKVQLDSMAENGAGIPGVLEPERTLARTGWISRHAGLGWGLAAVSLIVACGLGAVAIHGRSRPRAVTAWFEIPPPPGTTVAGSIELSPDGTRVAFSATTPSGRTTLWVRRLDSLTPEEFPGTEDALYPFWSPDGRYIAFFAQGKLKKIRIAGGPPQVLCDVFDARGGAWNREGVILFAPNVGDQLYWIPDVGGTPSPVTALNHAEQVTSHQWPQFLPDGKHFLYLVWSPRSAVRGVYVGSLDGGSRRLIETDWRATLAETSDRRNLLLFVRGRALMAQSFDAGTWRLSGEPALISEPVWTDATNPGLAAFSASGGGHLAFRRGNVYSTRMAWYDREGRRLAEVGPEGAYRDLFLSPDETRVGAAAVDPQTGTHDIWVFDPGRQVSTRLSFHPADETSGVWSPLDDNIIYSSMQNGPPNLYRRAAGGGGIESSLFRSDTSVYATDVSPRCGLLLLARWDPTTKWDLWVRKLDPLADPEPFVMGPFDEFQAQFSPDCRWVAYTSNDSNKYQVNVQPFPAASRRWQISPEGGAQPHWRGDGKEIFYLAPDRQLMSVSVSTDGGFRPSPPRPLFATQVTGLVNARNHFLVSRDGQRFLINNVVKAGISSSIAVALNWTQGVQQ